MYTRPGAICITTAPTWRQVRELLWREIRKLHGRAQLWGTCNNTDINCSHQWYALGISTDDPDRFQGFHSEDLLVIVDEAAGVIDDIFTGIEGILTGYKSRLLLTGNPTNIDGVFKVSHHSDAYNKISIDAFSTPNFTGEECPDFIKARLISKQWQQDRLVEWGEHSPFYRSRILAEFPTQREKSLFNTEWLVRAQKYEPKIDKSKPIVLGADVARGGQCETCCYVIQGFRILDMLAWRDGPTATVITVADRILEFGKRHKVQIYRVDATGMGVGVADNLAQKNANVERYMAGGKSRDPSRFAMKRDEDYWRLREFFHQGLIGKLEDKRTFDQLAYIQYDYTDRSTLKVEAKNGPIMRNLPSPDRADALCIAFSQSNKRRISFS